MSGSDKVSAARLEALREALTGLLRGRFDSPLPVDDPDDAWDALNVTVNLMGEQLERQSREQQRAHGRQHKALAKLADSDERFRLMASSATDGIVMIDEDGIVTFWNDAATTIFGWSAEDMLGHEMHARLAPDRYRSAHVPGMAQFVQTGEGAVIGTMIELSALHKDGHELPVELSVNGLELAGKRHALAFIRDITERRAAEQTLKRSRAELAAKVDELADALAHIKTLQGLLPICMHCKCVRDDKQSWQKIETYITEHSEATFTHSLCPKCLDEHYPEQ